MHLSPISCEYAYNHIWSASSSLSTSEILPNVLSALPHNDLMGAIIESILGYPELASFHVSRLLKSGNVIFELDKQFERTPDVRPID